MQVYHENEFVTQNTLSLIYYSSLKIRSDRFRDTYAALALEYLIKHEHELSLQTASIIFLANRHYGKRMCKKFDLDLLKLVVLSKHDEISNLLRLAVTCKLGYLPEILPRKILYWLSKT